MQRQESVEDDEDQLPGDILNNIVGLMPNENCRLCFFENRNRDSSIEITRAVSKCDF